MKLRFKDFAIFAIITGFAVLLPNPISSVTNIKKEIYNPVDSASFKKLHINIAEKILGKSVRYKPKYVVYGFLPYWTLEYAKYIDYSTLTNIAYFSIYVDGNGDVVKNNENKELEPGYSAWKNSKILDEVIKKAKENNVRVALTIAVHNNDDIENLLKCATCWENLNQNIVRELNYREIRDINLDFEYTGVPPALLDIRYANLVSFLKSALSSEFKDSQVVVSTYADSLKKPRITNIKELGKYVDAVFVMAYDFYKPTSQTSGPVAPIGGYPEKYDYDLTEMTKDFLKEVPAGKIILGVPYYGYNWIVESEEPNAKRVPGEENTGFSIPQTYSDILSSKYKKEDLWDEEAKSPYFSYFNDETGVYRQVYYENAASLREKYKFAKKNNFLGIGIWALGYDGDRKELWNLLKEEFPTDK